MTKPPLIFICAFTMMDVLAAGRAPLKWPDFSGPISEFEIVRRALRDHLWPVAKHHAERAEDQAAGAEERNKARFMALEALARDGRAKDILEHLEVWNDATAEGFRYWRAWACWKLGRITEARTALESGEFSGAEWKILALRLSARIEMQAKNLEKGNKFFREVSIAAKDAETKADNAVDWALSLEENGDIEAAYAVLKAEGALDAPGRVGDQAKSVAASLAAKAGKNEEALSCWKLLFSKGTNVDERLFVDAACGISRLAWEKGATNEAVSAAVKAVERAHDSETRIKAGYLLAFERLAVPVTRNDGIVAIHALVKEFPGDIRSRNALLSLADDLLAEGNAEAAEVEYRRCLELQDSATADIRVLAGRGRAFSAMKKFSDAASVFARAAQLSGNAEERAELQFQQADALCGAGRFAEAEPVYAIVVGSKTSMSEHAMFNRADVLVKIGKWNEAAALYRSLVDGKGEFAMSASLRLASNASATGTLNEALEIYGRILADGSIAAKVREEAFYGRGRAYYRAMRFKDAASDFAEVAKLAPARVGRMTFLSAMCLYGEGRDEEAREKVSSLLSAGGDAALVADATLWMAKLDYSHGDWVAAENGFKKFAETCPKDDRVLGANMRAARCAAKRGDWTKAEEFASEAIKAKATGEEMADALVFLAEIRMELARFEDVILAIERAMQAGPGENTARRCALLKADANFAIGATDEKRYAAALEQYRSILADSDLPVSLRLVAAFKTARTLEKLNRIDDMIDQYYSEVVQVFVDARSRGEWFDSESRGYFVRAAFTLADRFESRGETVKAAKMLQYVRSSALPAAAEATRRLNALKEKGIEP